jgi:hypothetical protein
MANNLIVKTALSAVSPTGYTGGISTLFGAQVIMDWYTYMAMIGAAFQVRAGTITTPLVGDVVITDTAAEMSADALSGTTIIPVNLNIGLRLLTGTLHEYAAKSVKVVSSGGTAFVPLPLRTLNNSGGTAATAAVTTARVAAAGGVTVTAELATTTVRHWNYSNPAAGATGALPTAGYDLQWNPRVPPFLAGPACFYVQIAATGTGPSYYANFDYIEAATATLLG